MSRTKISEYSATAADNTDINAINIAEGCAPSGINNAIREMMKQLKDFQAGTAGDPLSVGGNLSYTGTLTGSTGILNIGSGQIYKDASGNVGVGTATPAEKLQIASGGKIRINRPDNATHTLQYMGAGGTGGYVFDNINNDGFRWLFNGSEVLRIAATTGNVGIGATAPASKLDISGPNDAGSQIRLTRTDNNQTLSVGTQYIGTFSNNPMLFFANSAERMRITSAGNVGIGTGAPTMLLHVNGSSRLGNSEYDSGSIELNRQGTGDRVAFIDFHSSGTPGAVDFSARLIRNSGVNGRVDLTNTGTGSVHVVANTNGVALANGATSWAAISDERLKTDLVGITNAVSKVASLRAVTGRYKTDDENKSRAFLIAQEIQAVLPEAVDIGDDEMETLSLRYTDTIPLLVAAIKEQQAQIEQLRAEIEILKGN
jgi:hypothetical protein